MPKTFEEEFNEWFKHESLSGLVTLASRDIFFAGYMRGHEAAKQQALATIAKAFDPREGCSCPSVACAIHGLPAKSASGGW